jgi:2-desacetyl-2-hydroxyethyl bacteriochlorophyllide A dehydrogenase
MRTIVLQEPGRFVLQDTSGPEEPPPGFARLRVYRIGVCGTDLHAYQGKQPFFTYPRILGHELGVEVTAVGEGVAGVRPGDRCAVVPYLHCGRCVACRLGKTNCCVRLEVLGVHTDGGMREEILLPADKLLPSTRLSLDQLALVETLSIGAHAVDRAQPVENEAVLVIGAGPIGLSVIQFARLAGARIILMELSARRIAFCGTHFDLAGVIDDPARGVETLQDLLAGELPTAVFDATGSHRSMMQAFRYVANGGRLIFVGITQENITFLGSEFHRREMTILSSRNARKADLQRVMRYMESGAIDSRPWITHLAGAEEMISAFPSWLDPDSGVVKAMVALE